MKRRLPVSMPPARPGLRARFGTAMAGARERIGNAGHALNRRHLGFWLRTLLIFALLAVLVGLHASLMAVYPYHLAAEKYDITEVGKHHGGCQVVDSLGRTVGRIFASNLEPVCIDDLPPHLVQALVATEDAKFFQHRGADLLAMIRAARVNLRRNEISQGASTITQQLARSVYQMDERTFERKLLELFLARRIERHYSKAEILEQYLNRVYFGSGCWGIGAAARDYFGKTVQALNMEEAALLVGVIKRPVGFSPLLNPAAARAARDHTLERMERLRYLTPDDGKHFRAKPMRLQPRSAQPELPHYLLDHIGHETRLIFQERKLPAEGFVVHTSADLAVQDCLRRAIDGRLPGIEASLGGPAGEAPAVAPGGDARTGGPEGELQAAAVLIHNRTGRILASVGGRNYERSQFNRVFQARRPPGSCFLPFVYAAVFDRPGLGPRTPTLDTALDNRKVMIGGRSGVLGEWGTEQADTVYEGEIPAAYALLKSRNAATVRLGARVGLEAVCSLAEVVGFESSLRRYPATLLGASEVSLVELARAFTVFPNQGLKPPPASLVDYITRPDGTMVYQRPPPPATAAVSPATAGRIARILQMSLYGAPNAAAPESRGLCSLNLAGKSGTVHDFTDAWFVGFDAELTCGVWVGYDQPRPLSGDGFGHKLALPLWVEIMNALGADAPLPSVAPSDGQGLLFCNFPHPDTSGPGPCPCLLHQPGSSAGAAVGPAALRPAAGLPQPVRPQVPVLSGNDPYRSAWPAAAKRE